MPTLEARMRLPIHLGTSLLAVLVWAVAGTAFAEPVEADYDGLLHAMLRLYFEGEGPKPVRTKGEKALEANALPFKCRYGSQPKPKDEFEERELKVLAISDLRKKLESYPRSQVFVLRESWTIEKFNFERSAFPLRMNLWGYNALVQQVLGIPASPLSARGWREVKERKSPWKEQRNCRGLPSDFRLQLIKPGDETTALKMSEDEAKRLLDSLGSSRDVCGEITMHIVGVNSDVRSRAGGRTVGLLAEPIAYRVYPVAMYEKRFGPLRCEGRLLQQVVLPK